jgi:hypothetical protein
MFIATQESLKEVPTILFQLGVDFAVGASLQNTSGSRG